MKGNYISTSLCPSKALLQCGSPFETTHLPVAELLLRRIMAITQSILHGQARPCAGHFWYHIADPHNNLLGWLLWAGMKLQIILIQEYSFVFIPFLYYTR